MSQGDDFNTGQNTNPYYQGPPRQTRGAKFTNPYLGGSGNKKFIRR